MPVGLVQSVVSAVSSSVKAATQAVTGIPATVAPLKLDKFEVLKFPGCKDLPLSVPVFKPGNLLSPEKWLYGVDANMTVICSYRLINDFL